MDVFEDTPVGSTVLMLFASDLDSGQNAKINYRLESPSETFKVERNTGALVVASTVDRESVSTYILTVLAEDSGLAPLSDRTDVEITIIDVSRRLKYTFNGLGLNSAVIMPTALNVLFSPSPYNEYI